MYKMNIDISILIKISILLVSNFYKLCASVSLWLTF